MGPFFAAEGDAGEDASMSEGCRVLGELGVPLLGAEGARGWRYLIGVVGGDLAAQHPVVIAGVPVRQPMDQGYAMNRALGIVITRQNL